tara:strand:- start:56 stop:658 length:603 start_codon:yes stop_codon:yes gene_type:complete
MSIIVTPIPRLIDLTAPSFTLGTANAAGSAVTAVASDSTLLAFDTTLPDAITFGQSGAAGSATTTSRRDHAHAMAAETESTTQTTVTQEIRAAATASGTITYTGAGFVPTGAIIFAINDTSKDMISMGGAGGTGSGSTYINDFGETGGGGTTALTIIAQDTGGSNRQYGTFGAFTADGLSIEWVKGGSGQAARFTIVYLR